MAAQPVFLRQVKDALNHLYEYACLETHPLALRYWPETGYAGSSRAQRLHDLLLESIEELQPAVDARPDTLQARCRALLLYRFVEQWPVPEIMRELSYSRRQFFREQRKALSLLADALSQKLPPVTQETAIADDPLIVEAVRILPEREAMNPAEVAYGAIRATERLAKLHGVELECDPGPLPPLYGNRTLLRQILLKGLSFLIARAGARRICLCMHHDGRWLAVELRASLAVDGGEHSEVASRSDAVLQEERRLVEMMSGKWQGLGLSATGCRLRFAFPAEGAQVILVVEDNEAVTRAFSRYLAGRPYQVIGAATCAEALRLAKELRPSAITLDIMMPGQDGWETLQALKNDPHTQHIPVIICSAVGDPDLADSLGAAAYLHKPVSQVDLLSALGALLTGR